MAPRPRNRGVALVITLAMIAMLTFLIVAFFSRAIVNVQIESSSTGNARADILAKSAAQIVVSDFRAEIVAGSTASGSGTQAHVYIPLTRANAVPAVVQASPAITGLPTSSKAVFANLVKQSTDRFFPVGSSYPNANPVIQTVTPITTDVVTPNGRSVVAKRWDSPTGNSPLGPMLLISTTTPTYSRFYYNTMLPHWVMITRQGVPPLQTTWVSDWKNYLPSNPNAAIGRFAYNVYDVGGLLDVNVAGYPETGGVTLPATALGQKGTLGLAQLSLIPGLDTPAGQGAANATRFTSAWRNLASSTSAGDYLAFLGFSKNGSTDLTTSPFFMGGPKYGFLRPAVGTASADNRILGRQDLIRLAAKVDVSNGTPAPGATPTPLHGLNATSLPHLTHFTRELNAPGWTPVNPPGSSIDYAGAATSDSAVNRAFPSVRVPAGSSWTRLTGEPAVEGEPLVKYRFPLSWLALLQDANPATVDWDLTPEAIGIVNAFEARRLANGGTVIPGGSTNAKAAWLVQQAFGLNWNTTDNRWDYTGSTGRTTVLAKIDLLGDIVTARPVREPNFFELLKAGLLSGSLGNASDYESFCVNKGADMNKDFQVIQIGANIIDQADSDSYPTLITFGTEYDAPATVTSATSPPQLTSTPKVFAGVEDVPYLQTILGTLYRRPAGQPNLGVPTPPDPNQTDTRDYFNGWTQFVVWKPQQQSAATASPTNFRIRYTGGGIYMLHYGFSNPPVVFKMVSFGNQQTAPALPSGTTVSFVDSPTSFRSPTLLGGMGKTPSDGFVASQINGNGGDGIHVPDSQMPRGMWLGEAYRPEKIYTPGNSPNHDAPATKFTQYMSASDSTFEVQYQDGAGNWRTYQKYDRFGMGSWTSFHGRGSYGYADSPTDTSMQSAGSPVLPSNGYPAYRALDIANFGVSAADPRSHRYGLMAMYLDPTAPSLSAPADWKYYLKQGWAPSATSTANYGVFTPSNGRFTPSWTGGGASNPWSGYRSNSPIKDPTTFWADNPDNSKSPNQAAVGYTDPDGVTGRRRADGDSSNNVRPMQLPSTPDSPLSLVLNRPFRSVGELSYAFRDEPYKSLNLFSANSADGALLDIFSVNEQPALVAGKVNLNTKDPNVLQAVIIGATREEFATTPNTISVSEALAIATNLVSNTSATPDLLNTQGPLLNPGEIANRLEAIMKTTGTPNQAIKTRREAVARALAGSGQTRTWNFLVDIVAQSGRYGPNASKIENFIVEGEKRYWLHVAIDRYTGQVIDQQLEPVME